MLTRYLLLDAPLLVVAMAGMVLAAGDFPAFTSVEEAGRDYQIQGEYSGELDLGAGRQRFGAQVIALGEGQFRAVLLAGGLPGDGWQRGDDQLAAGNGASTSEGKVTLKGVWYTALIDPEQQTLSVASAGGEKLGELKRVERKSPSLGAKPPEGAVVLFSGENLDAFNGGTLTDEGTLLIVAGEELPPLKEGGRLRRERQDVISLEEFGDCRLHLEFATPFMPTATGQARGNSGVYVQNRYEVQVLDSFGLEGADNECGGLYKASRPALNMCLPPLAWQTYDIVFTAPTFNKQGNRKAPAKISIEHNGVLIHDNVALNTVTPGGQSDEAALGPLKLQDHGNPVQYRNIWIVPKEQREAAR